MNLTTEDAQLFYRLHHSLLAYANRHLKVLPRIASFNDIGKQPFEQIAHLRDALYEKPELLERFVAENPERLPLDELTIVASWRQRIRGDFYVVRHLKRYAVFMTASEEPTRLYGVFGLYEPIEEVTHGVPLPLMVHTALLPFREQIVYDGIISVYSIVFGGGFRAGINDTYNRLKEREGITEQLVSATGEAQVRTSLARQAPRKPAPDWRPVVAEIVAQTEKMRRAIPACRAQRWAYCRPPPASLRLRCSNRMQNRKA